MLPAETWKQLKHEINIYYKFYHKKRPLDEDHAAGVTEYLRIYLQNLFISIGKKPSFTSRVLDEGLSHVALGLAALAGQVTLGRRVRVVQGRVS